MLSKQSLLSAFLIFGMPGNDRRGVCLQDDKWDPIISHTMLYLDFIINSQAMTVSWPLYKRQELFDELQTILLLPSSHRHLTPKQVASILGKLRSAIQISPWGVFLSFSLAATLKSAARIAFSTTRSWWSKGKIWVDSTALRDICLLMETLLAPNEDPMWRVTREELVASGFHIETIGLSTHEATDPAAQCIHINPLEFLAVIINLWLALKIIGDDPLCLTGTIIYLLSDNTTALSWMHVAAPTPNPELQQLARFASALLVQAAQLLTRVQPLHIPGKENNEADNLN
jgi:hypothetical protein